MSKVNELVQARGRIYMGAVWISSVFSPTLPFLLACSLHGGGIKAEPVGQDLMEELKMGHGK